MYILMFQETTYLTLASGVAAGCGVHWHRRLVGVVDICMHACVCLLTLLPLPFATYLPRCAYRRGATYGIWV